MSSELNKQIIGFSTTELVNINPKNTNLAIDTMCEWTKGFVLINEIILVLSQDTYKEDFMDDNGRARKKTKMNNMLLPFIKERRALMDQYWKISGGEAINEAKKEVSKQLASTIFNFKQDKETNEKYRKKIIDIIEEEMVEKVEDIKTKHS